jgi:hypothetical protein
MSRSTLDTQLADRRYATVVLRLQLDRRGRLIQGEMVDTAGEHRQRFVGWRGLTRSVRDWLQRQEQVGSPDAKGALEPRGSISGR